MTTYKPLVLIAGLDQQLDSADALQVSTIDTATLNLTGNLTVTGDLTCCDATVNTVNNPNYIQFNTSYSDGFVEGRLQWNSADGTLEVGMPGGHVNLQIGQETLVRVRNVTGATINNGTLVTINGSQANRPKIEPFDDSIHDSVCGYTTETINHNSYGYVTLRGIVRDIDTSTFNEGDHLWADVDNPGQITNVRPEPPQHRWCVGVVLVSDENNGMIFADFEGWHHLEEASDVSINSANLAGGEAIIWDVDNQYWKATGTPDTFPQYNNLKTGWDESAWTNLNLTLNTANYTATLSASADTDYWIEGVRHTLTANSSLQATLNNTEGMKYLILNSAGALVFLDSAWDIHPNYPATRNEVTVANGYWSVAQADMITRAIEFHGHHFSTKLHEYLHENFGTRWAEGLGVSTPDNLVLNVAEGEVYDEDIEVVITDGAFDSTPPPWFQQPLTPLDTRTLYRSGPSGNWLSVNTGTVPCIITSNIPQDNTWNGTAWNLVPVGVNRYFVYWLFASSDRRHPVYLIPGQTEGGTLLEAEDNNQLGDLQLETLATAEHKAIAKIIMQRQAASPFYRIAQIDDYRFDVDSAAGTSSASDHGSLSGLSDDDHTQYVLVNGTRAMTGNLTVNASINATGLITANGNMSCNTLYTNSAAVIGGAISGASLATPQITSGTGTVNFVDSHIVTTGNIDAASLNLTGYITGYSGTSDGEVLTWVTANSRFEALPPASVSLDGLSDVTTANAATGDVLTYNSGNTTWYAAAEPTHTLNDLSDVTTANATTGDVLTYNSGNSTWYAAEPSSTGSSTISSNTTYYIATTGNDTTGDGTANSPWATISKAYDYLADKRIDADAYVTFQLADGTYTFTSTVNVNHPDSNKITVTGNLVNAITSSNIVSISGTQPNRTMVLTVSDTTKCAAGDIIRITGVAGGTKPGLILGATRVESVNSGNNTITVNFYQRTTRYAPSGAVTSNIDVFKTNITFNACNGFTVANGNTLNIDKVGLDGLSLTNTYNGLTANTNGIVMCGDDVSLIRFNYGYYATLGGIVEANYAGGGACASAFYAEFGSEIYADWGVTNGCSSYGLHLIHGSFGNAYGFAATGHGGTGIVLTNAMGKADYAYVIGNGGAGAVVQQGSSFYATNITLAWCESRGILTQFNSYSDIYACNVTTNQDTGVYNYANSNARADTGSVTSNGNGGIYVAMNSTCSYASTTVSGNTGFQTSPATIYTVGNYESFVF